MHPQTLRKYERLGLIQPSRTIGSMRLYSRDELERLRLIKRLVDEVGINLAGVQRLLSIAEVMHRIQPLMDETALSTGAGRRQLLSEMRRLNEMVGASPLDDSMTDDMEFKDYYATLGVNQELHREGDQAGLPEARAQASPGREPGRQGGGVALQGDQRGLRGPRRSGQAQEIRRARRELARLRAGGGARRAESVRRRSVERQPGRRPGRLPHDDAGRNGGDVRGSEPLLRLLHDVLRRRRLRSARVVAPRRRRRRRRPRTRAPAAGTRRRARDRAVARGRLPRHHAPALAQARRPRAHRRRAHSPPASATARASASPAKASTDPAAPRPATCICASASRRTRSSSARAAISTRACRFR